MSSFNSKYQQKRAKNRSVLCIGLDPDPALMPANVPGADIIEQKLNFLKTVIDSCAHLAVAWKPNLAFYEYLGSDGWNLLQAVVRHIRRSAPDSLVILDAKRADIGNTARFYARALFEDLNGDAVTLSPYMGLDSLEPFLEYKDRACIVLCHTSNPGALDMQLHGNPPLYLKLAESLAKHPAADRIWLVVGATRDSDSLQAIRRVAASLPFLVPGIGAQGGDLNAVLNQAGPDLLVNVGRSILYASTDFTELAVASEREAGHYVALMQKHPLFKSPVSGD
ncbi:MAG: orotidine-5'-phosphate decarboxylase [Leptospiraceae bacterium]|nr:orotidine-5'-phosphate decarboxylase [Leptospiraceae bacterium]